VEHWYRHRTTIENIFLLCQARRRVGCAVQNIALLMITPMFLALRAPLTPAAGAAPGLNRGRASRALHTATARLLTFPLVVTAALIAPLFVLYPTPLYEASLRSTVVGAVGGPPNDSAVAKPAPARQGSQRPGEVLTAPVAHPGLGAAGAADRRSEGNCWL
jgi:hypothetical protein